MDSLGLPGEPGDDGAAQALQLEPGVDHLPESHHDVAVVGLDLEAPSSHHRALHHDSPRNGFQPGGAELPALDRDRPADRRHGDVPPGAPHRDRTASATHPKHGSRALHLHGPVDGLDHDHPGLGGQPDRTGHRAHLDLARHPHHLDSGRGALDPHPRPGRDSHHQVAAPAVGASWSLHSQLGPLAGTAAVKTTAARRDGGDQIDRVPLPRDHAGEPGQIVNPESHVGLHPETEVLRRSASGEERQRGQRQEAGAGHGDHVSPSRADACSRKSSFWR